MQQLDPLRIHLVGHECCAGEISAGPAEAIHQPSLHRIAAITEHHGSRVDCSAHEGHDRSLRHDNLYVERQQFAQEFWHAITDIGRPTLFDNDGSTLDVVQLPQSLSNGIKELRSLGRADCDPPDPRHPCRLLCAYGKRISRCRTAEQRDDLAAFHLVTSISRHVGGGAVRATKTGHRAACHSHAADSCSYCRNSAPTRNLPRVVRGGYHNSGSGMHINRLAQRLKAAPLLQHGMLADVADGSKTGKSRSEQMLSALPPLATGERTFWLGSFVPNSEVAALI